MKLGSRICPDGLLCHVNAKRIIIFLGLQLSPKVNMFNFVLDVEKNRFLSSKNGRLADSLASSNGFMQTPAPSSCTNTARGDYWWLNLALFDSEGLRRNEVYTQRQLSHEDAEYAVGRSQISQEYVSYTVTNAT